MNLQELREKRLELYERAQAIPDTAEKEGRAITDEEQEAQAAILDEFKKVDRACTSIESAKLALPSWDPDAVEKPKTRLPDGPVTDPHRGVHESAKDDDARGWESFGHFAVAVHSRDTGGDVDNRLRLDAAAGTGMEQGKKADGGVLVPPAYSARIWNGVDQAPESLLRLTDQLPPLPVGQDSITYPANAETSRADGSRAGGIQGYWKAELTQMTESNPTLREVKYEPEELYVYAFVSDKLLRNAANVDGYLTTKATEELSFKIGNAIINGTGTGQPVGIITSANKAKIAVGKETQQAATTIVTENIDKMVARLHPRAKPVWLINVDTKPQLWQLVQEVGTAGIPLFRDNIREGEARTLKGYPVIDIEYCATLGTEGDIILVDLKYYGTITRSGGVRSASSIHLKFDYNQTAFRFLTEVDGQPWLSSAITPYKGATDVTLSPFITLATRS